MSEIRPPNKSKRREIKDALTWPSYEKPYPLTEAACCMTDELPKTPQPWREDKVMSLKKEEGICMQTDKL